MEKLTMTRLMDLVTDESSAYLFMEQMRWGDKPFCPHCHSEAVTYLNPANSVSRKTRTGNTSQRRVWKCRDCRKQFSVLTGTVFQGTKIPVRTWLFVVFEMVSSKNGVAAREIERKYGLTNKTAWFMLHRIRAAMDGDATDKPMGGNGGTIVADETYIGGRLDRMNNKTRKRFDEPVKLEAGQPRGAGPAAGKTVVLSLIDTATGEARSQVVRDVTAATLRKAIADQVVMSDSRLVTDEGKGYIPLGAEFIAHETVNHSQDEYARYVGKGKNKRTISSNAAESFFSQLKRSIDGTHHKVSSKHLPLYLGEFDFRHTTRKLSDSERFLRLFAKVAGVRLTYRPLTAG